jgi:PAS domain S-box-containing protein
MGTPPDAPECFGPPSDSPTRDHLREQLKRSRDEHRQFLETLFSAIPSPLYYKGADGYYLGCNAAFEALLGRTRRDIVGRTVFELYPPEHAAVYDAHDRLIVSTKRPAAYETTVRPAAGPDRHVILSKAPFFTAGGEVAGILGVLTDITVQKSLETDLRRARDEAEAANAAKNTFLTNMSHELRTPLNGIMGMTEMLLADPRPPQETEALQIIRESCGRLTDMVNDLLSLSTLLGGAYAPRPGDFDIRQALAPLFGWFLAEAAQKGLAATAEIAPGVPPEATGDMERFRQVILNLLENALRFTPHGRVAVVVETRPGEAPDGEILLSTRVSDTGVGIAPDKLEAVFEDFVLAEDILTKRFGRTGMGLSISRRLARTMGGDVTAESVPGAGSTFTFTARLPLPGA